MYLYHVAYVIQRPFRRQSFMGDMTVELRHPVTTAERVMDLKHYIGRNQRQLNCIADVRWITITNIIELSSHP